MLTLELRELKRIRRGAARKAAWADPAVRAKMSAARKAALAEKREAELQPKRKRGRATQADLATLRDPYDWHA